MYCSKCSDCCLLILSFKCLYAIPTCSKGSPVSGFTNFSVSFLTVFAFSVSAFCFKAAISASFFSSSVFNFSLSSSLGSSLGSSFTDGCFSASSSFSSPKIALTSLTFNFNSFAISAADLPAFTIASISDILPSATSSTFIIEAAISPKAIDTSPFALLYKKYLAIFGLPSGYIVTLSVLYLALLLLLFTTNFCLVEPDIVEL